LRKEYSIGYGFAEERFNDLPGIEGVKAIHVSSMSSPRRE